MKKFKKLLLIMAATMIMLLATVIGVNAESGKPGDTVSVTFYFEGIKGLDASFSFSDRSVFEDGSISYSSSFSGAQFANNKVMYYTTSEEAGSGSITVSGKIKGYAAPGSSCTITMTNIRITDANSNAASLGDKSGTVSVVAAEVTPTPDPGNSGTPNPKPETSDKGKYVDYSKLKKYIEMAEGLVKDGYTKVSWDVLVQTLANAKDALNSNNQTVVDTAAQALSDAIDGLVKMDYSKLEEALEKANTLMESEELVALLRQLIDATNNGVQLLDSDDQEAVDQAAEEINSLLARIQELLGTAVDVVDALEEEESGEPEGPYCNMAMHKVWPILFFVSLAGNGVLIYLIFGKKRTKKTGDDTPIVDYEIGDDDL